MWLMKVLTVESSRFSLFLSNLGMIIRKKIMRSYSYELFIEFNDKLFRIIHILQNILFGTQYYTFQNKEDKVSGEFF
jgi:hypothetical protein